MADLDWAIPRLEFPAKLVTPILQWSKPAFCAFWEQEQQ
jgi:hypothetical protein